MDKLIARRQCACFWQLMTVFLSRPPNRNSLQPAGLRAGSDWLVNYQQSGDFT
jgi:hypothetical protein